MIALDEIGPRAIELRVDGGVTREEVGNAIDALAGLGAGRRLDVLATVAADIDVAWLGALGAEASRLPAILALLRTIDRLAVVIAPGWMQTAARVESRLIPGLDYRVFDPADAAAARAFVLRR